MALINRQTQAQLDEEFTPKRMRRLEIVAGHAYSCTGGYNSTRALLRQLKLNDGDRILDVGSGLGGASLQMAHQGAFVWSVDWSANMMEKAREYTFDEELEVRTMISFLVCDIRTKDFGPLRFDFIFCRESLMYFEDKESLLTKLFGWLKPGGKILIAEYCEGVSSGTPPGWMTTTQYHLSTIDTLDKILGKIGYEVLESKDKTKDVLGYLNEEVTRLDVGRNDIIDCMLILGETIPEKEALLDEMTVELKAKVASCLSGETTWGYFLAKKP